MMPKNGFVDATWLLAHLDDPRLRIVDARNVAHGGAKVTPGGSDQYHAGHIPNAIHLDYAYELADPATPYAARVAPGAQFAQALGLKGIGDDSIVVAYDDGALTFAARIVWMLYYYGHDQAYIFGGGIRSWLEAGQVLSQDLPEFAPATFTARPRPELRATREEVLAVSQGREDAQLVETQRNANYDARSLDMQGAIRLSGQDLLEDARGGQIAPPEKLEKLVAERELDKNKRTIVSCGSGVAAAGSYFALKAAGFHDVAVYDGSWLEWSHDGLPTVSKAKT
jgi:thiosulfate/3-mercaptopyruvate sulfurtransferase